MANSEYCSEQLGRLEEDVFVRGFDNLRCAVSISEEIPMILERYQAPGKIELADYGKSVVPSNRKRGQLQCAKCTYESISAIHNKAEVQSRKALYANSKILN